MEEAIKENSHHLHGDRTIREKGMLIPQSEGSGLP